MIDVLVWFDPGDAAALGAAVVMLQITAVIGLAAAAARWLARGAAARHVVWLAALGCVLVSPIIAAAAGRLGLALLRIELPGSSPAVEARPDGGRSKSEPIPILTAPPVSADAPRPGRRSASAAGGTGRACRSAARRSGDPAGASAIRCRNHRTDGDGAPCRRLAHRPGRIVPGVGRRRRLPALRLLHGRRVLARWRRASRPADAWLPAAVLDAVRSILRVRNLPPILLSPLAAGPSAVGVLHPCVLLPDGLLASLDDHQLRDVLIHECARSAAARSARRPAATPGRSALLAAPAAALSQPPAGAAREEVCDDYVFEGRRRPRLCPHPVEPGRGRSRLPVGAPGLFGSSWKLEDRVAGLLDPRRTPMTRVNPWTAAGVAAVLFAACIAGAAVRRRDPPVKKPL